MSKLVVVESPAKAKTIEKYLPKEYRVRASVGHVRDLPDNVSQLPQRFRDAEWATLGVDIEKDFTPVYVVKDPRSKKAIAELKKELKGADELILATDEDREGEAISWHIVEVLKPKVPVRRMVFHEITKTAIQQALENTREIDAHLVEAQETRRILDRLVGYPLSLLVAQKIKHGLSAGRVQSPAVFLVVERERERRRFRSGEYWTLKANLVADDVVFGAEVVNVAGKRVAQGRDFNDKTGLLNKPDDVLLLDEKRAKELSEALAKTPINVTEASERAFTTSPKPPFTTSTLQQAASRRLNFSASETMSIAQRLYEQGFITYMRTDSTHLSDQALGAARAAIETLYGPEFLPPKARTYRTKARGAQEAHEAIRPTGDNFTQPEQTGLRGKELRLYDMVWKRSVASQMVDARKTSMRLDFRAEVEGGIGLRATGTRVDFPGFMLAYVAATDEDSKKPEEVILPAIKQGDDVDCESCVPQHRATKPPARFTEATLVEKLEEAGIGRPSTYATIISKISDGRFARREGRTLVPTYIGFAVAAFLENYFPELVDLKFTARLEDDLDGIASGSGSKAEYLHRFYREKDAFADQVQKGRDQIVPTEVRQVVLEDFEGTLRVGRYGSYVELDRDGEKVRVNVPEEIPPADLTIEAVSELLAMREREPESLGDHPETGEPVLLMNGRYGWYLQLGQREGKDKPKTGSIPPGVDPEGLSLEDAVKYLELPRKLGKHPEDRKVVDAGIGRYGPYVRHNKDYRNLPEGVDVFTVSLADAVELLAQPKKSRRRRAQVLKELGPHPSDGGAVQLLDGRYGPYVKWGKVNASLPKGLMPDDVTMETAMDLIDGKDG